MKRWMQTCLLFFSVFLGVGLVNEAFGYTQGIYITQSTLENNAKLQGLITQSKKYGIDTFVIDVNGKSKAYATNIQKVIQNGIHYVARVVIFPHGGTHAQVTDKSIWVKRLNLAKYAVSLGASAVQLDYIRYRAENPANPEKAKFVMKVVKYFKTELAPTPLQMDIFGIAANKPAHTIGQDPGVLAQTINAFCPMVYPSHYEPYREHAIHPYTTIFHSISSLKKQIANYPDVKIYAYIEIFNYRYPLSPAAKTKYILDEMKAAKDGGASGWYVWSATNHYSPLFNVLAHR